MKFKQPQPGNITRSGNWPPSRITVVDTVRVAALIGICIVNLPFIGLPIDASFTPPTSSTDQIGTFLIETFFQAKFFLLFSFLFGWSLHYQMHSAKRSGVSFNRRYFRRLTGLGLLGVLHAILVFSGDILLLYALLGILIWPLLHLHPVALTRIALTMIFLELFTLCVLALLLPDTIDPNQLSDGLGGSFAENTRTRWTDWPQTFAFLLLFQGPLAFGAFALGLAAARTRFFEDASSIGRKYLRKMLPWLVGLGLPLNLYYAAAMSWLIPPSHEWASLLGFIAIAIGAPALSAVYLYGLLVWANRFPLISVLKHAGRSSLSVYVLQGILAGALFGGYGLGLFGSVGQFGLIPIAVAVALCSMVIIGWIAKRHGLAPLETVLRSWTYGQIRQ